VGIKGGHAEPAEAFRPLRLAKTFGKDASAVRTTDEHDGLKRLIMVDHLNEKTG